MKLFDVVLFVAAFSFFVIGIHQAMVIGLSASYWIFMFSLMPLFLYGYRKNNRDNKGMNSSAQDKAKKRRHG